MTNRRLSLATAALVAAQAVFTSAQILGPVVVIGQLGVLAGLLVLHREHAPRLLLHSLPVYAFGLWAAASTFWSSEPDVSLRYGLQLLATCLIGVAIAGGMAARRLPASLFIGTAIVFVLSIATRRYGLSDTGPVLIGLSGSKNAFAYLCLLHALSALALVAGVGNPSAALKAAAALLLPLAMYFLARGQAASAQVQFVLGASLFVLLMLSARLSRGGRAFALLCAGLIIAGFVAAAPEVQNLAARFQTDVLRKDSTLTGRTYLWAKADEMIEERPIIGWGYRSAWLGSQPQTIGLLRWAKLSDGRGFNFHNTVRELRVDLGLVGLVLAALPALFALSVLAWSIYVEPRGDRVFLFVLLVLIACVRTQTESIFSPFTIDTVLVVAICVYAAGLVSGYRRPSHREGRQPRGTLAD